MWHWFFSKFIIKVREQVVADLGLNLPARSYEEQLVDFLSMLIRMAGSLLAAFVGAFYYNFEVIRLFMWPVRKALYSGLIRLGLGGCLDDIDCGEHGLLSSGWVLLALVFSLPILCKWRRGTRFRCAQLSSASLNFK